MAMYTEFHFNSELECEAPQNVINILKFMGGETTDISTCEIPEHELFKCDDWDRMLKGDSACFAAKSSFSLNYNESTNWYTVCIICSLKNTQGEINKFVDWITPYLLSWEGRFLGYSRFEGFQEPNLIYCKPVTEK